MEKPKSIDEYIATFPPGTREKMEHLRVTILKAAPKATEVISYGMPAFKQHGVLVYFAGYKQHIGFYPTGSGIEAFKDELSKYKWSKGAVQFPLDKPLPLKLVTQMVKFRVVMDAEKAKAKKK
jgi:uncharacterized protein YdhG (YjbR/CyaY superfamily)